MAEGQVMPNQRRLIMMVKWLRRILFSGSLFSPASVLYTNKPHDIKQAAEPGNNKNNMKRLDVVVHRIMR